MDTSFVVLRSIASKEYDNGCSGEINRSNQDIHLKTTSNSSVQDDHHSHNCAHDCPEHRSEGNLSLDMNVRERTSTDSEKDLSAHEMGTDFCSRDSCFVGADAERSNVHQDDMARHGCQQLPMTEGEMSLASSVSV